MLPSSGYFRNILCPFFVSGFCERPHCHFKHEKRGLSYASTSLPIVQQNSEEPSITSTIGQKTDLLQYYSDAIKKLQEELQAGTTLLVNKEPNDAPDETLTYIPTPVNKPKTDVSSPNGLVPRADSPESPFFFYKPTPISKLNKLKGKSENEEYVPVRIKSKSSKFKRRNHEEYDPTKVVPSAKKLKTIEPSSSSDNEMCIDTSYNDGAFSDDESQESLVNNNKFTAYSSSSSSVTSKNEKTSNIEPETTKCNDKYDVLNKILIDCKRTEKLGKTGLDHEKIDRAVEMCKKAKESLLSSEKSNDGAKNLQSKSNDNELSTLEKKTLNDERGGTSEKKYANHKSSKSDKSHSKSHKSSSNNSSRSHKRSNEKDHKSNSEKNYKKNSDKKISENEKAKRCEEVKKRSGKDDKSSDKEAKKNSEKEAKSSEKDAKKSSEKETKKGSEKDAKKSSEKEDKKSSEREDKDKKRSEEDRKTSAKDPKKSSEREHKKYSSSSKSEKHSSKSNSGSKSIKSKSSESGSKSDKNEHHKSSSKSEKHSEKGDSKSKLTDSGTEANDQKENRKKYSNKSSSSNSTSDKSKSKYSSKTSNDKKESDKHSSSSHSKSKTKTSSSNLKSDKLDSENPDRNRDNCSTNENTSDKLNDESSLLGFDTSLSNNLFKNIEEKMEMDKLMEEYGSELDEHDTEEECWKIFNEAKASEARDKIDKETLIEIPKAEKRESKESNLNSSLTTPFFAKKRQAHQPTFARVMKPPKKEIQSPAEVLQSRYEKLQQMYLKSHPVEKPLSPPSFVNSSLLAINKKRVAHVPNAALIAAASLRVAGKFSPSNHLKNNVTVIPEPTIAVTNPKGTKRVAHVPSESVLARPKIPVQPGSKVPHNTRQRYLDKFIEECLKCCSTADEAYKKALEEENTVFQHSSTKNVYLNKAVNTILKLRLESSGNDQVAKGSSSKYSALAQKQTVSHEAMLGGAKAAKTTYSIVKKEKHTSVISGLILYKLLTEYLLTPEQLEENGYPIPNPDAPGKALFKKLEVAKRGNLHNPLEKTCCRCQKWYRVDTLGNYVTKSSCSYHWGRLYKRKVSGSWQSRYSCCDGDHESIACSEADGHVHDEYDPDKITGFMQTFSKQPPEDGNYGVYALDCEMCYTVQGTELTRITVIGEDLKPVYETFVKPDTKVLDYNTRFSGITEDDLKNVSTTIRDVQAVLLSMFSDKTILIGHSLESDFRALRLIHNTVVDTAIVFPHKNGPPFKRALRNLVAEYLSKIIQNSVDGHDSQEDAASCMELMLWKIKQDMFKRR